MDEDDDAVSWNYMKERKVRIDETLQRIVFDEEVVMAEIYPTL